MFAEGYISHTLHLMIHKGQCLEWWGNDWENWCFIFERTAGKYTKLLKHFNHKGSLSKYIYSFLGYEAAASIYNLEISDIEDDYNPGMNHAITGYFIATDDCNYFETKLNGDTWWRCNGVRTSSGLTLKFRTKANMKKAPWEALFVEDEDHDGDGMPKALIAMYTVLYFDTQVILKITQVCYQVHDEIILIDGVAKNASQGDEWCLMGIHLKGSIQNEHDLAQTIRVPTGKMKLEALPLQCVRTQIALAKLEFAECTREGAKYSVIEYMDHFMMNPKTSSVFQSNTMAPDFSTLRKVRIHKFYT